MKTLTTTLCLFIACISFLNASAQNICTKSNQVAIDITYEDGQTVLNWHTAKETNSSYFLIEKSTDGTHFTAVKMIQAAGNSNFTRHYIYTEVADVVAKVFYRVTLVTMNGEQIASVPATAFSTENIAAK